ATASRQAIHDAPSSAEQNATTPPRHEPGRSSGRGRASFARPGSYSCAAQKQGPDRLIMSQFRRKLALVAKLLRRGARRNDCRAAQKLGANERRGSGARLPIITQLAWMKTLMR